MSALEVFEEYSLPELQIKIAVSLICICSPINALFYNGHVGQSLLFPLENAQPDSVKNSIICIMLCVHFLS